MPAGALTRRSSGSKPGDRRAARDARLPRDAPPWRQWRTRSRAARCIRWIETYCRVPVGDRAGELIRLARFQRECIEELLASGVRTGGLQIPRGNAKSTLWAAVGLWAVADVPDRPQVPLIAFNGQQAMRTLFEPAAQMVRMAPELSDRLVVFSATSNRHIWSPWNDGRLRPLPAEVSRLQGLNPAVALVDEAQTIAPDVLHAVMQGAGKRSESLVLAIGTPRPDGDSSALFDLRERAHGGAPVCWIEFAAAPGCAVDDRGEWRRANPALAAGFLHQDALEAELLTLPEQTFRMYRLGQWIDVVSTDWLPLGAWEACPLAEVPPDGAEVILGLAGTWTTSVAVVGATLDGGIFLAWSGAGDDATDPELERVLAEAWERWTVLELVVAPKIRASLVRRLQDGGLSVTVWPSRSDLDASSSADFRRAIVEARLAHDHHPLLAEHISALAASAGSDGSLRLVAPADGREVDAARAARMAWWRAVEASEVPLPAIY